MMEREALAERSACDDRTLILVGLRNGDGADAARRRPLARHGLPCVRIAG